MTKDLESRLAVVEVREMKSPEKLGKFKLILMGKSQLGIISIWDYPNLGSETDRIWTGNGRGENEIGSIRIRFEKVQVRTGLL